MNSTVDARHLAVTESERPKANARIGAIARELHEALRTLGAAPELQQVLREIPDTRSRLAYVGEMTEKAAHRVLGLVEDALPRIDAHVEAARCAAQAVEKAASQPHAPGGAVAAALDQGASLAEQGVAFAAAQRETLTAIMMAQDFQDLSGQVIKKVIDVITRTETQLLQLLVDEADGFSTELAPATDLQGPQVPGQALQQDDVDDLLASLGF